MEPEYSNFLSGLKGRIPEDRIYIDPLRTFAWGTDASLAETNEALHVYSSQVQQSIVIRSGNEEEVALILKTASECGVPVTFRAAGTALSGQSVTDSVLVVAGKNWEGMKTGPEAETVSLQPGLVGGHANAALAKFGRKLGPDPASIGSAMIGGIVMNNASGMSCGTHANSDRMMTSARILATTMS